jgi:hypothetical protein
VHCGDSPLQLTDTELMDFSAVAPVVEMCLRDMVKSFEELCKLRDRQLVKPIACSAQASSIDIGRFNELQS